MSCLRLFFLLSVAVPVHAQLPDISSVTPDLQLPSLGVGKPAPGKRVKATLPGRDVAEAYHVVYLPRDWSPDRKFPVLVEYAGNGPYRNRYGDVSTGRVEGSRLGYGISGGEGFIWLCLPYLDNAGITNVAKWWGTAPTHDPGPTIDYCLEAVKSVCREFNGNTNELILCGFSRGAIACNYIGLHEERIAKLWRAFIPYSHYDGVRTRWPYPGADRRSALQRLGRLDGRPQFICGEGSNAIETKDFLLETKVDGKFTFRGTGFRNHNDAWVLRPSSVRTTLRNWVDEVLNRPRR